MKKNIPMTNSLFIEKRTFLFKWFRHFLVFFLLIGLFLVLSGCGTKIGTRKIGFEPVYKKINNNALQDEGFTTTSKGVLLRYNLDSGYKTDPRGTLAILQEKTRHDNRRDLLFALAELNYDSAGGSESKQYYLNAAVFAYFYLFEPNMDIPVDPYNRNFRRACDLYNIALARSFTEPSGTLDLKGGVRKLPRGSIPMTLDLGSFPWDPESDPGSVLAADALDVYGLSHRNRESGIGVPFIVVMDQKKGLPVKRSFPGTLMLKFEGGLKAFHQDTMKGQMVLHPAFNDAKIEIADNPVPLERDISVQLAYTLNQPALWDAGFKEFFTGKSRFDTGLYQIMPHSSGKVPVVFVHGTFSNPVAWVEMAKTLMADPIIRDRFQFWFYLYDSNQPVTLSALYFRGALKEKIKALDPDGNNPFLNHMVVIGHSQGGLLTKLTATDTGDEIIRSVLGKGLDELDVSDEQRMNIKRASVFESLPFVKRVVFISTPHRGSSLVTGWVRNFIRKLVTLPAKVLDTTSDVMAAIPEENIPDKWHHEETFTSIDSMSPDNPALIALSEIELAHGVKGHSIIAVKGDDDPIKGTDGVVTYESAHLDYVESEFIVQPCDHSSQWHPLTIEEVRRILHLHLKESNF